ncbi:heavy metal-binding domain-containing protein [Ferrimonas senticii]|uniref:heavy metal-binding domain-containing protein n=1 Tax=Ferrimonas senticii TaxID=394566 RepID=UPI00041E92D9|nr:heavy metal-binding domain-containing protein [Ferrimonas senticii]
MKTLYSCSAALLAALLTFTSPFSAANANDPHHGQHHQAQSTEVAAYACPMHPQVTGQQGDECPKCGMKLEATGTADSCPHGQHKPGCKSKMKHHQGHGAATHACPMNPSITGQAGDECPKCGMALEPLAGFACPMHPKVTGQMGDECPKCGMKLTRGGIAGGHAHHSH